MSKNNDSVIWIVVGLIAVFLVFTYLKPASNSQSIYVQESQVGDPDYPSIIQQLSSIDRTRLMLPLTIQATVIGGKECPTDPSASGNVQLNITGQGICRTAEHAGELFRLFKVTSSGNTLVGDKQILNGAQGCFNNLAIGTYHYDIYYCTGASTSSTCADTDGGDKPNTAGTVTGTGSDGSFRYVDYCVSSDANTPGVIYEWYCSGTSLQLTTHDCSSGTKCTGTTGSYTDAAAPGAIPAYCKTVTNSCTPSYTNCGSCNSVTELKKCYDNNCCSGTCTDPNDWVWVACPCSSGTTKECIIDSCGGTMTCSGGIWGECIAGSDCNPGACQVGEELCDDGICRPGCNDATNLVESIPLSSLSSKTSAALLQSGCSLDSDCIGGTCKTMNWLTTNGYLSNAQVDTFYGSFTTKMTQVATGGTAYTVCHMVKTYLGITTYLDFGLCNWVGRETGGVAAGMTRYVKAVQSKDGSIAGVCVSSVNGGGGGGNDGTGCPYIFTDSSSGGILGTAFKVDLNYEKGSKPKCIPAGCRYLEEKASAVAGLWISETRVSNCCSGAIKDVSGTANFDFLWVVANYEGEWGTCTAVDGICRFVTPVHELLKDLDPEGDFAQYYCGLSFGLLALILIPFIKDLMRG